MGFGGSVHSVNFMQAKHLVMAFVSSLLADEQGCNVGNNVVRHPVSLERWNAPILVEFHASLESSRNASDLEGSPSTCWQRRPGARSESRSPAGLGAPGRRRRVENEGV